MSDHSCWCKWHTLLDHVMAVVVFGTMAILMVAILGICIWGLLRPLI